MNKLTKQSVEFTIIKLAVDEQLRADPERSERLTNIMKKAFDRAMDGLVQQAVAPDLSLGRQVAGHVSRLIRNLSRVIVVPTFEPIAAATRQSYGSAEATNREADCPIQVASRAGKDFSTIRVRFSQEVTPAAVAVFVNDEQRELHGDWDQDPSYLYVYVRGTLVGTLRDATADVGEDSKVVIQLYVEP